jgi:hypothetical protein
MGRLIASERKSDAKKSIALSKKIQERNQRDSKSNLTFN